MCIIAQNHYRHYAEKDGDDEESSMLRIINNI